jgi:hypothetical protein
LASAAKHHPAQLISQAFGFLRVRGVAEFPDQFTQLLLFALAFDRSLQDAAFQKCFQVRFKEVVVALELDRWASLFDVSPNCV